jgi:hypothetical protein
MVGKVFHVATYHLPRYKWCSRIVSNFAMNHNTLKWIMITPITIVNVAMEPQTFKVEE